MPPAVLRIDSKCPHTACMPRFFTVSRLARNPKILFLRQVLLFLRPERGKPSKNGRIASSQSTKPQVTCNDHPGTRPDGSCPSRPAHREHRCPEGTIVSTIRHRFWPNHAAFKYGEWLAAGSRRGAPLAATPIEVRALNPCLSIQTPYRRPTRGRVPTQSR